MMRCRMLLMAASCFLVSCVTSEPHESLPPQGPLRCEYLMGKIEWKDAISVLNRITELFHNDCFEETIQAASKSREKFRYKHYSVTKEAAELFLAEGTVTDYVLESYERGYLSFLTAASFIKLKQKNAASVELNRFYNEEVANLYNHGQDPVNALLQAALWDNIPREGFSSRPFWLWLSQADKADSALREFAKKRVKQIDSKPGRTAASWEIFEVGRFPEVTWTMKFTSSQSGYFSIKPNPAFPSACIDTAAIMVPTSTWFHKIAIRHSHDYHPLVNVKSWIRLPIGLIYGITTVTTGASLVVGGCVLDLAAKGDGALCKISIQGGAALISKSDDVVDTALSPDLRHWENLPAALYLRLNGSESGPCLEQATERGLRQVL